MRYMRPAIEVGLCLICSPAFGQVQGLSIANYELVNEVPAAAPNLEVTYRAAVVNTGAALPPLTATVTSLDPFSVRVVPGAGTLNFGAVPAKGEVMSSNTVTLLVNSSAPLDFSNLKWTFQTSAAPVANAGPNETVPVKQLVILNGSGSTNPSGVGTLTYSWRFTSVPAGSRALLGHSSTAFATFTVDVPGSYIVQLTVSNGVASSSASVTVSTSHTPPVANACPNQTVTVGATVVLNGSGSTSTAGLPFTYAWTLIARPAGSTAALSGADTISPTFVVDKDGVYQAQLIVNDGLASSPATVTITTQTTAPVANAGPHQIVDVGTLVQLNGAGSTDANGLTLTYLWSLVSIPAGSAATLNNPKAVNPTFAVDRAGTYVAQLIVSDGKMISDPATVTITTEALLAPTANAGQNRTVAIGSQVTLSGSGADSLNLPVTFQWSLISKPSGSAASLSSAVIADPTFVADRTGIYVAQLIVSDGLLSSTPSTVTISTTCSQPVADAGSNQNVTVGQSVTLDGIGSGDVCRDPLTYAWTLTTRPPLSGASLSGPNTATPTLVADVAGVYVAQLIVNNGYTSSNPATVTISASGSGSSGTILLPANLTIGLNQSVTFPVTLSVAGPASSVYITLNSSDTSKVTVTPTAVIIPPGAMKSSVVPMVKGMGAGSATITASAFGLTSTSQLVQVTSGSGTAIRFSPASLMINGTSTQSLTLLLPAPAPSGGLVVQLTSSNPGVAAVPPTVSIGENSTGALVPVTGVSAGTATITATAPSYSNATAAISVFSTEGVSGTWYGACWVNTTIYGVQGNFQAIDFSLVTPTPVTVQGTLFFTSNCDPSGGTDNMNDFGTLTGTTHMIQGFTHHPNQIPSSAIYWVGPLTANGMCPLGSPCSGCVNYTTTTPLCSTLP